MKSITSVLLALLALPLCGQAANDLESGFLKPPPSARPWVYWFPLDGNISSNGITLDLEAMQRVGIGGVLYMETDQGAPTGPAPFAGPLWRNLFKHICAEAQRLGLEVNVNNDAGWCGSGGPWITPELSMQVLVWSQTNVAGPCRLEAELPQPRTVQNFYRDIAVFAFPTPANPAGISKLPGKSVATTQEIPLRADYSSLPPDAVIPRDRVLALSDPIAKAGRVAWDVPSGNWTILRLGCTTTGKDNHPAPASGRGLECDKLSKEAAEVAFGGLMSKIIRDSKPLVGQKKTIVSTHIDSWEVGSQNWTPKFREEFKRLRGYDPLTYLPVMAGHVIDNLEVSERFLWDVRMTVSDLLIENYAGRFQELARANGIRLSIEAYGEPADDLTYAGRADEPMAEFWSWDKFGAAYTCASMSSAAHVYGKRILGAEAFTAADGERWRWHPGMYKDLGDWAFCEGINRFVFHRYALQPWDDVRPGMSMGPWGLHYERTQTWWEQSKAWHEYLARCQFLLQQGLFVADLCFLAPEMSPQSFKSPVKSGIDRPGYSFDGCPPEVVLTRMKVKDGRLVLPDGMSYRMLVLPQAETMTPRLLSKIRDLVADGATVVGAPPRKSPSLENYPVCDAEIKALVADLWGPGEPPAQLTAHSYGKGRVFWGGEFKPSPPATPEAQPPLASAKWIWFNEGNPSASAPAGWRYFRRVISLDDAPIVSAALVMTADNSFECAVNGKPAGSGSDWAKPYEMDVKPLLKPGPNTITVNALNGTQTPSPAGLIGSLRVEYADHRVVLIPTDSRWEASQTAPANSNIAWSAALELGPLGSGPWGDPQGSTSTDTIPDINILCRLLAQQGLPPDFQARTKYSENGVRFIHRRVGKTEIYFVANKNQHAEEALCSFRVTGRIPELWNPESGQMEPAAVYDEVDGVTRVPLCLEGQGSVFVVFRRSSSGSPRVTSITLEGRPVVTTSWPAFVPASETPPGAASNPLVQVSPASKRELTALVSQPGQYSIQLSEGGKKQFTAPPQPEPLTLSGPWEVSFAPGWGAPDHVTFNQLISWSEYPDAGVKYFSGAGTYSKSFEVPADLLSKDRRFILSLGQVAVIAEVTLNGRPLGTLWKAPFELDITSALRSGENQLQVKVVNLWINRQIGDEFLPEDSDRNPEGTLKSWPAWVQEGRRSPTGRYTFTSWRLWKKADALVPSGLLGPVQLRVLAAIPVKL